MAFGKRSNKKTLKTAMSVPQTSSSNHPFQSVFSAYSPTSTVDYALYKSLREAIPIIDAAILKLTRLMGTFEIKCEDEVAQRELKRFLETVKVGGTQQGISSFLITYFEQLLTFGTSVGEIVLNGSNIVNLYNTELKNVALTQGKSPLDLIINADNGYGQFSPVKYPNLVLALAHNPEPGSLYGTSILKGLPFVSDILLKIFNTTGINWQRVGNVRFAVTYKPQNDVLDKAYAQERAMQMASEWANTMSSSTDVRDFVAVGDIGIKAIGADNQILDSEVPVRQMLEQIVAKLGVPPFLLGLNWSSTEKMSYQQADILTSELEAYRIELNPIIIKICSLWLRLNGYNCDFEIEWSEITLQDITELAQSRYYDAQSAEIYNEIGGEQSENN
ncbi:MAG: serine/threonine protein phosphatase [Clostridia bacterium]